MLWSWRRWLRGALLARNNKGRTIHRQPGRHLVRPYLEMLEDRGSSSTLDEEEPSPEAKPKRRSKGAA